MVQTFELTLKSYLFYIIFNIIKFSYFSYKQHMDAIIILFRQTSRVIFYQTSDYVSFKSKFNVLFGVLYISLKRIKISIQILGSALMRKNKSKFSGISDFRKFLIWNFYFYQIKIQCFMVLFENICKILTSFTQ